MTMDQLTFLGVAIIIGVCGVVFLVMAIGVALGILRDSDRDSGGR